ncbi:MAG: hypothetical protein HY674_17165 [Chloroflexi bacterium]|nr:hypothetical protein [Chloroflexota bacterium]
MFNLQHACPPDNADYTAFMLKVILLLLVALTLVTSGCKSQSGSREFIPGKGWAPTK